MQKREGPSEWEGRDGAKAMHSAVLLKLYPFLTWGWTRTRRAWESCQNISEIATVLLRNNIWCMQSLVNIQQKCRLAMKSYLLHLKQSFIDVSGKASKINVQYCPRSSKLPEEYVKASPTANVGQPKHNLSYFSICSFWQSQAEKKIHLIVNVRFLVWEWYIYTLVHIQGCAIKLNTASVARGACATVITTLFPFSLLYHSE